MFEYDKPMMELLFFDEQDILTVSDNGIITDPEEGDTPFVPGSGVNSLSY